MTEQEMRRRMNQAMDTRLSGVQEDPWLAQRVMNQPKGEKKVKRFTVQTVLAMMLLLAIMGTVYAASLNSAPDDLITNTPVPASEGMGEVDAGEDAGAGKRGESVRYKRLFAVLQQ